MTIINLRVGTVPESNWIFQEKTVTPSASTKYVTADSTYTGLSKVTVMGDSDLVAKNIKKGITIFGITGTYE